VPTNRVFLNITDMATWRKKNRVDDSTKVFIIKGGYGDVKKALKKRGWFENKDKDSTCFDLKWTLKSKDIDSGHLHDF
jgi:tubulin monoglycylase TTLL3/8